MNVLLGSEIPREALDALGLPEHVVKLGIDIGAEDAVSITCVVIVDRGKMIRFFEIIGDKLGERL